ncbi:MAG: hypothetical protein KKH83_00850, partial [Candidatus Margulisbacteria bacterium]|nr:hypothetical protein [Candidatus Margulisiibacteriota bacterium]
MNVVGKVKPNTTPRSADNTNYLDLASLLLKSNINLYIMDKNGDVDVAATIEKVKGFLQKEKLAPTEASIKEYLRSRSADAELLSSIDQFRSLFNLSISKEDLPAFLAGIFAVEASAIDLKARIDGLVDLYKNYRNGLASYAIIPAHIDEKEPIFSETEKANIEKNASELINSLLIKYYTIERGLKKYEK